MAQTQALKPAAEIAQPDFERPNHSAAYRRARTALLVEEIELRRHIERVAQQRRELPLDGEIPQDFEFTGPDGPVKLSQLFGGKDSLIVYNFMYGPQRERPCPMCTSMLSALDGEIPDILQRVAVAVVARSPIGRILAFKQERGWRYLPLYSSGGTSYNELYAGEKPGEGDNAGFNVFHRKEGRIYHFWGDEMGMTTADPGQDPRGAPDPMPIWTLFDMTPQGRGKDWYPKLQY